VKRYVPGTLLGIALETALLLSSSPRCPAQEEPDRVALLAGDANQDGRVDVSDIIRILQWYADDDHFAICLAAADANRDGRVDVSDAARLADFIFNTGAPLAPFPAELDGCIDAPPRLQLENLEVSVLTPRTVMLAWDTPFSATTRVRIGVTPGVRAGEVLFEEATQRHRALLRGLVPDSTYYVVASSDMPGGELAESEVIKFRTLPDPGYTVREDRPRLFLTAKELSKLRAEIEEGGQAEAMWELITQWCASRLDFPLEKLAEPGEVDANLRTLAFAALVGRDKRFRLKAVQTALHVVEKGPGEDLRSAIEGLAFVYDWLHADLEDAERSRILKAILKLARDLDGNNRDDEYVTGLSHGNHKSLILGALAAYGDHPQAARLVDDLVANYRHGFLATWRRFAGKDGGSSKGWWYTTYALPFELEYFAAWRSATGQDLFQPERVWCEPLLDWFLHGTRGDGTLLRDGDTRVFNGLNYQNRHFGLLLAREYGNAQAQWFADRVSEITPPWGPHAVFDLLWGRAGVEAEPPRGPTSKLFRQVGVAVLRESWDPDAVLASFRSAEAYTLGHTHRDNCSFTLFYKGGLAIDSGIYDDFDSKHHDNYYTRTVAHNTLLVDDPDEEFTLYGVAHVNDGGQRWLVSGKDVPRSYPGRAEDTVRQSDGYRLGGVARYEDAPSYTYVVGNGGPSYSRKKLKRFLRHFVWLKSVAGWEHPVIVVFDDTISTRASFKKTYLLHTQNKPEIDGRWVTAANGEGKLHHITLAPADAELELIGGRGKEFWVKGHNYAPLRGPQDKEEAGAWRLEVSPGEPRTRDHFLHVLYPGDLEAPAPEEPEAFGAGSMQGCRIGEWTILFDAGAPVSVLEYPSERATSSHLVFGAVPFAVYELHVGAAHRQTLQATFSGTLRFDLKEPGKVRLVRVVE
jgi:hypothetical protein